MKPRPIHSLLLAATFAVLVIAGCRNSGAPLSFAVIGMPAGALSAMEARAPDLGVRLTRFTGAEFASAPSPDLAVFDAVLVSFAATAPEEPLRAAVDAGRSKRPDLKVLCLAPAPICGSWSARLGPDRLAQDPVLAGYYGLSREAMGDALAHILATHFGRATEAPAPDSRPAVAIHHPRIGSAEDVADFLERAAAAGLDVDDAPRVAVVAWRHHVLFHQPKVIDALIDEMELRGFLAVVLVADAPALRDRLRAFAPDLVVQTSHTEEPASFWQELGVPRIHALWFTDEPVARWRDNDRTGMTKSSLFHQVASAELKGATETLTAGGTESGADSGDEVLPIPDRIARIGGRVAAWIALAGKPEADKRLAVVVYDNDADKAGLMMGPAHNLNAPKSMVRFLSALRDAGYGLRDIPGDERELLDRMVAHGRQMGAWEPGALDRLARGGQAVLVPEARYREWFEALVPERQRAEVVAKWGPVPGDIMVWTAGDGSRHLVLPGLDLGNVRLVTQPLKGETITASLKTQDSHQSLQPPTHHYLATYFWIREAFGADAVVHFGSHGTEWLFPGKQAVLSEADWSDILLGDLPNINPWLASNTAELLPCKRRAMAVTVGFLPAPLMEAGLPDELANLESTVNQWQSLAPGALKRKYAQSIGKQARATGLAGDLGLDLGTDATASNDDIARLSLHLHDLGNTFVPAAMHVLGEPPPDDLRVPYLVHCLGKRFTTTVAGLLDPAADEDDRGVRERAGALLLAVLREDATPEQAVAVAGGRVPDDGLPEAVAEGLATAREMDQGFQAAGREIESVLDALDGRFVAPGSSGNPERNPAVVPTGRNLFLLNPEEFPSPASWELGTRLLRDQLERERAARGRYPNKIAFSLVPYATYSDFGIIESQILYLMGVRPVWDARNRVRDVELIPREELGRPRIDVFLSARGVYRDELPSLMRLLDKAVRLAASAEEPDNGVRAGTEAIRTHLEAGGMAPDRAGMLAGARMFGAEPREVLDSHDWFFYLTERSGEWENREELVDVYMEQNSHVYTEGAWGDKAPEAFARALAGTELILRSWYDNRDFALSNKFTWWVDGSLSLAVKHLTGQEPGLMFVDVRDRDEAQVRDARDVVQADLRARLQNPRWIRAQMDEGHAGANLVAKVVDNLMGWETMREHTVTDANWEALVDTYVRDAGGLGVRSWFEASNPHAFQKVSATLVETMRKGFWAAGDGTRRDVVAAYADSVVRHGLSGGIRAGGNAGLETFVQATLAEDASPEAQTLLNGYRERLDEARTPAPGAPAPGKTVRGTRMERAADAPPERPPEDAPTVAVLPWIAVAALALVLAGFLYGGGPSRASRRRRT